MRTSEAAGRWRWWVAAHLLLSSAYYSWLVLGGTVELSDGRTLPGVLATGGLGHVALLLRLPGWWFWAAWASFSAVALAVFGVVPAIGSLLLLYGVGVGAATRAPRRTETARA